MALLSSLKRALTVNFCLVGSIPVLLFGLGQHAGPVTVEILWPNGETQTLTDVETDKLIAVRYGATQ